MRLRARRIHSTASYDDHSLSSTDFEMYGIEAIIGHVMVQIVNQYSCSGACAVEI